MKQLNCIFFCMALVIAMNSKIAAQSSVDTLQSGATLQDCINYAIQHQPVIQQSLLDEQITERQIRAKLADWYPQVSFGYNLQHYFNLPTSFFGVDSNGMKQPIKTGVINSSVLGFAATQNIFNRDVLLASRTAADVRLQARQATANNKITVAANVSKAFYDVLLSEKQIQLLDEDIVRLERSLKDAYNQYQGGIVDKIDYKRATIALNNAKAQRKSSQDLLKPKYAVLKELMGYPAESSIRLSYDSTQMEQEARFDTTQTVDYKSRIEYKLLQTQQSLQQANLKYYRWAFLPTLAAFGNYNLAYQNDRFAKLYGQAYSNSYIGLSLSLPLFQGTKRIQQVRQAELELRRVDYDIIALKNSVNTEYVSALAVYQSNLDNYTVLKDNLSIAQEVYNTIQLQYKAGIKTYLDVIIAESDLRTTQVNYTNALYSLLSSKVDVQKALGNIQY